VSVFKIRQKYIGDKKLSVVKRMGGVHREIAELFDEIATLKDQKKCLNMALDAFLNLKLTPIEIMELQEEVKRLRKDEWDRKVKAQGEPKPDNEGAIAKAFDQFQAALMAGERITRGEAIRKGKAEAKRRREEADESRENHCSQV
jgi:hypothetical protein